MSLVAGMHAPLNDKRQQRFRFVYEYLILNIELQDQKTFHAYNICRPPKNQLLFAYRR